MNALIHAGVNVKFEPCEHCDALPSDDEIDKAIKWALREMAERVCAVCGQCQHLDAVELYHYKECGQNRWGSRHTEVEPMLLLEDLAGLTILQVRVHPKCAMKAMPRVKWGFSI